MTLRPQLLEFLFLVLLILDSCSESRMATEFFFILALLVFNIVQSKLMKKNNE